MKFFEVIFNYLLILPLISCEFFTSIVHLEKLLTTEITVIDMLEKYLLLEEERISRLEIMKDLFDKLYSISNENARNFLANPINAYILIKRLTSDLEKIENSINDEKNRFHISQIIDTLPSSEDLKGSAEAIFRLQDTYKLKTKSLADGYVLMNNTEIYDEDNKIDRKRLIMSSDDCFKLGHQAYWNNDFFHAEVWFEEAMERLKTENNYDNMSEIEILDYLAFTSSKTGNISKAIELTQKLLILSPGHQRASSNLIHYQIELEQHLLNEKKLEEEFIESNDSSTNSETEQEFYESLCRGENRLSDKIRSKLVCFHLNTTKIPYLRYTRIKVEEAFKKPQVVVFHNFMFDSEIEIIKSLAEPKLERAGVKSPETGKTIFINNRISESAFIESYAHPVLEKMERRIGDVTGLELSTAEHIQVGNYGMGGHYAPHYDFRLPEDTLNFNEYGTGNRIATWMNYMSDVEAGGATVFPLLGITVWPEKSSAVFWYNLKRSGEGDYLTKHGACPVLVGSKWVSNKWFRERGHEFSKPCSQTKEEYNIIQDV